MYSLFFLLAVTTAAVVAENSYVIVCPAKFRANTDLILSVDIIKAKGSVTVTASILKGTVVVATASGTFQSGTPSNLTVKIPADVTGGSYTLKVEGSGGLTFSNESALAFNSKQTSVFVQTDKAIYKPGDVVNWRAFATDSDLKLYTENFNISMHDAGGNKIKQWLQEKPDEGVVTGHLTLSSEPSLGDWKIRVETANSNREKTLTVEKYVLPKFEATIVMPAFVLTTESEATVTIKAKYTYGKPVKGSASVSVKLLHSYNSYDPSRAVPVSTIQVQLDGETKVSIPLADVKKVSESLDGHFLIVTANVSESLTGNTMSAEGKVKMYDKGVTLEFPQTNPNTFKPGLRYTAYLKVSQPDGLPAAPSNQKVKVNVELVKDLSTIRTPSNPTETVSARRVFPPRFPQDPTETVNLPEVEFDLPSDGLIMIPLDVPVKTRSATIRAEYQGVSASLSLGKSFSPSNSYIQLFLETPSAIQAGNAIAFKVKATYSLTVLAYQVMSRGKIVKSGSVKANSQREYAFSITTDSSMAPKSRIIIYHVKTGGEIVTDSISFDVSGVFRNKVAINFNTSDAEPGQEVKVTVRADPSSTACVSVIDQSVLLLKSGNDVTQDDVIQEIETYDTVVSPGETFLPNDCINCFRKKRSIIWRWPIFIAGKDASDVFQRAGVIVITDALVYKEPVPLMLPFEKSAVRESVGGNVFLDGTAQSSGLMEPAQVRSNFVETWMWTNLTVGADGTASVVSKVPDTITSWVASAFAVNSDSGLGIAPTQAKMRVFRPFFVSLNLPYSVIRGEKVILQAIVFNYLPEDLTVQVTLALSKSFSNILIDAKGQEQTSQKEIVQNVLVRAGDAKSVFFPITPLELGKIDIEVKARSTKAADAIRRQLLVKAEGVSKDYNIAVLIDLTEGKNSFSQTVNLSLPTNVVKESQRVRISAVGDLMGPTIGGLDSLLQMPMGCGEQTMLSMAPDVYITDYLTAVNQLTADIKSKALNYMESGYQRELTYKHKDGSFSAFGESDKSGSMWLTAFVMRVFNQAKPHIYIDEQVMITSLRWIIAKQNSDGSFPEPGVVIHTSMQGNAAGGIALTLYVMITLLENKDRLNAAGSNADQVIAKALSYAEAQIATTDDLYTLALASYAFELAKSSQTKAVLTKLEAKATVKDGLTFWHQVQAPKTSTSSWESPNPTQSTDTEMTAYILLTYIVRGEIAKAKNIVQWLIKQRNPHGGFQSTQDTVVALHALSQFAKIIYSKNFNLQVTATLSPSEVYTFNIDQSNALVLQTHETKDVPSKVKIDATGSGIGLVEVAVYFNVESDIGEVTFELSVKLVEETMKHLLVETCTKWIGEGASSGMAIQEFGIPSGFKFDIDSFRQIDILKKIEFEDRKVVFYFDKIGTTPICLQMRVKRDGLVAKSQPVPVKVIDYYNPNNQVTVFYQSAILKNSTICDVVNEVDNCVSVSK